ncbi:MAG TPA: hypothetical protein VIF14_07740 [Alphaproteobacteria bacterium]|jgi:hypothetical protein
MSATPFGSVLFFASPAASGFVPQLAEWLKARRGARVVLVANTEQDRDFYQRRHPGLFAEIATIHSLYTSLLEPLDDETRWIDEAAALERRFGFRFTHLLMDDRHLGLGFSAGGTRYPETRWARLGTRAKAIRAFVLQLRFLEKLIVAHKTTLIVNPTKTAAVIARALAIPMRVFTNCTYRSYYTWAVNEFLEIEMLPAAFARASAAELTILDRQHDYYVRERTEMLNRFRFGTMVRLAAVDTLRYFYWVLRRYEKRLGRLPLEQIGIHYRVWSEFRALRRHRLWRASELENRRFVYFPLSVEPEITLTRESPEFCHQAYAVHAIAKELPPDTLLAVKEHVFTIGMRPKSFYRDLARIPNLVFVDPLEWGLDVIRRAAVVATVNGTSGFEAAVLGKPVLAFGVHSKYNILPHVRVVEGWRDMPAAIADVLAAADLPPEARSRDGRRFLNALVGVSVDCAGASFRAVLPETMLDQIAALLERSLLGEDRPAEAAAVASA